MDDLLRRLREAAAPQNRSNISSLPPRALFGEAAEAIEALEGERDRLRAELLNVQAGLDDVRKLAIEAVVTLQRHIGMTTEAS